MLEAEMGCFPFIVLVCLIIMGAVFMISIL
jgi:hypothetical protein